MKIFQRLSFTILTLILLIAGSAWAAARDVSATDAQSLLRRSVPAYLLDVRTMGEYMQKRIAGSHLIPIDQIPSRLNDVPRDRPVLVYCETGVRSAQVARFLDARGFREVYNLTGGIMSWQVRGYPILTGMP